MLEDTSERPSPGHDWMRLSEGQVFLLRLHMCALKTKRCSAKSLCWKQWELLSKIGLGASHSKPVELCTQRINVNNNPNKKLTPDMALTPSAWAAPPCRPIYSWAHAAPFRAQSLPGTKPWLRSLFFFKSLTFYCCSSTVVSIITPPRPLPRHSLWWRPVSSEVHMSSKGSFFIRIFKNRGKCL